jgi:hypothetical protein
VRHHEKKKIKKVTMDIMENNSACNDIRIVVLQRFLTNCLSFIRRGRRGQCCTETIPLSGGYSPDI